MCRCCALQDVNLRHYARVCSCSEWLHRSIALRESLDGISAHPGFVLRASVVASTQSTLSDGLGAWNCGIVQLCGSAVQEKLPA
jgi:hypothetical protein